VWFLWQLIEANLGLFNAHPNGGGVAFFAHVGGFILARWGHGSSPRGRDKPRPGATAFHGLAPATEVQTGLVSGIVNTDVIISTDSFAKTSARRRPASGDRAGEGQRAR
jgi:hypothetical protein